MIINIILFFILNQKYYKLLSGTFRNKNYSFYTNPRNKHLIYLSIYLIIIILVLIFNYFIKNNYINLIINIILHSVLFIVIIFLYNIIKCLFPRIISTTEILHKIPKFIIIFLLVYLICFISILLYNSQGKITFILSIIYLLIFSFYYLNNTNNENKLTKYLNKMIFSTIIIYITINLILGIYLDISIFKRYFNFLKIIKLKYSV